MNLSTQWESAEGQLREAEQDLTQAESSRIGKALPLLIEILGLGSDQKMDVSRFLEFLPRYFNEQEAEDLYGLIMEDVKLFYEKDPSMKNYVDGRPKTIDDSGAEKLFPVLISIRTSVAALLYHRMAQILMGHEEDGRLALLAAELYQKQVKKVTGVEIHPRTYIGPGVSLDHAVGVVWGETSAIAGEFEGYHSTTLGASGLYTEDGERHPMVGSKSFMANGTQLLGPSVLEGNNRICAGSTVINCHLKEGARVSAEVTIINSMVPEGWNVQKEAQGDNMYLVLKPGAKDPTVTELPKISRNELVPYFTETVRTFKAKHGIKIPEPIS